MFLKMILVLAQDAMNKPGEAYVDNETVRGKDCTAVVCT